MNLEDINKYLTLQNSEMNVGILENLQRLKNQAVSESNEILANEIWCYEQIYKIQSNYLDLFNNLKNKKFFEAWQKLEQVDIDLSFLRNNYIFSNDEFHLHFIETIIRHYEKLFPYEFFMSRESIVKKQRCSICGKENTIRNHCKHKAGKLYMGEICFSVIEDIEFLGLSIVQNPFDKYTVLFPQDMEYNYFMLESLMPSLLSPYDRWYVKILRDKNPEYNNIGRNQLCPCGSGIKYKNCCLNTDKEYIDHHQITLLDNPDVKPVPLILGNTWKK